NRTQHQADILDHPVGQLYCRGHTQDRKIERAATAEFLVRHAPAGVVCKVDARQDLVGTTRQIVDAVVAEEIASLDAALATGADQFQSRAQRNGDGRGVGARDGPAAAAVGGDPADGAVLLHAEVDAFAPVVVLVVIRAARVQAQVAAERAHAAQVGRRYESRR